MLRRQPFEGLSNSRKSIRYYLPERRPEKDLSLALYAHMLVEDMHLGIMPIGGRSRKQDFKILIEPYSKDIEATLLQALKSHHGRPSNFTEAVCDYIDEVAHYIAYSGKAYYEIVYYYEKADSNKMVGFSFENIPNHCVKDVLGKYWQWIPHSIRHEQDISADRIIILPTNSIVKYVMPKELGGVRNHKKLLSELQWLSKCTIPDFAMEHMSSQKQTPGYDFTTYNTNQSIYLTALTRKNGWNARSTYSNKMLECYEIYRYLTFEKTKAILRKSILEQLNKSIKAIGGVMGFEATIVIQGMLSPQDYIDNINKLLQGTLSFSEAVDLVKI
jgi:hypothetical protein